MVSVALPRMRRCTYSFRRRKRHLYISPSEQIAGLTEPNWKWLMPRLALPVERELLLELFLDFSTYHILLYLYYLFRIAGLSTLQVWKSAALRCYCCHPTSCLLWCLDYGRSYNSNESYSFWCYKTFQKGEATILQQLSEVWRRLKSLTLPCNWKSVYSLFTVCLQQTFSSLKTRPRMDASPRCAAGVCPTRSMMSWMSASRNTVSPVICRDKP